MASRRPPPIKPADERTDDVRKMAPDRSRYGLLVSTLGALILAGAVFLPWYGVSFTGSGIAFLSHLDGRLAGPFAAAEVHQFVTSVHLAGGPLTGEQIAAVSAHSVLADMSVLLLILAGLVLLDALVPLLPPAAARATPIPDGAGGSLVLLGSVATACVLLRMIDRPLPEGNLIALSLREGPWLALLGGLMVVLGGLWPRVSITSAFSDARIEGSWTGLSGSPSQG